MKPIKNIQGQRFGRLIILKNSGKRCGGHVIWLCRCDCGNFTEVRSISLRNGCTKSCGCLQKERAILVNKKHGESGKKRTRLYVIWQGIKYRCYNSDNKAFEHYGRRGIKVCSEWKNDYLAFKKWALINGYADNLTIDRIDNDSDYYPENCQWITRAENTKRGIRQRITPRMYREQIRRLKGEIMTTIDVVFKHNAKPGKRLKFSNYCLSCTRRIPPDKDFCDNDICENNFYDESHLERDEDEALAEQEELEREERKSKAGLFEEER